MWSLENSTTYAEWNISASYGVANPLPRKPWPGHLKFAHRHGESLALNRGIAWNPGQGPQQFRPESLELMQAVTHIWRDYVIPTPDFSISPLG